MIGNLKNLTFGLAAVVAATGLSGIPTAAYAQAGGRTFQANLTALNKSDDRGNATTTITSNGNGSYTVRTTGSSAALAHAQHIHVGGTNTCPDLSADKDKDGLINTGEGEPSYGPIEISLTTSGDVSKKSGLAVDRMPVADANGTVTYERSFQLPEGVTEDMIAKGVVVTHGVSELFGDKAKYDGEKKSDIPGSEALPLEATIPAACGKLSVAPVGGAGAGGGSTTGVENIVAIGAGVAALAGSAIVFAARKRGEQSA